MVTARRENDRFLRGRGRYLASVRPEGMLHAVFVRSSVAHGILRDVRVDAARQAPGVVEVFTAASLVVADIPSATGPGPVVPAMTRPPLARDRVRHVGEAVAMVIAESVAAAVDAAELVEFDVEELPVVATPEQGLSDDTLLFEAAGTNVVDRVTIPDGAAVDVDRWPVVVDLEVDNPRLAPMPLEPIGIVAEPDGDRLTVWYGHQRPQTMRTQLADILGIPVDRLRIRVPDAGGSFGLRGRFFPEYVTVSAAALRLGRPVRWQQTRTEQFLCGVHGRGMHHRIRIAGDETGCIHAATFDVVADMGAYPHNGSHIPRNTAAMALGVYDVPEVSVTTTMVVNNRAPIGSYRGAGRPEATYAIERAVDAFAARLGMDPAEVRERNMISPDQLPKRLPTGVEYDSGDYATSMRMALDLIDADGVRAEQRRRRVEGGRPLGLGISVFIERAGGGASGHEYARVAVERVDGSGSSDVEVVVYAGTTSQGQGHDITWAQIASGALGLDASRVRIVTGDTDAVPGGEGSYASRSTQLGGSAILRACQQLVERARDVAARHWGVPVDDVAYESGVVRHTASESAAAGVDQCTLDELERIAGDAGEELTVEERFSAGAQTFPYGTVVAVVEVDEDTGRVSLERIVAVDDCGTVVNPVMVEGQVHGSLAQGVAQALYEEVVYDEHAQLRTASLVDYLVPSAADLPHFETGRLETPAPSNPLGAKGTGESGAIGAPPAIVNAVLDALRPLGVDHLDMPLAPQKVWHALQQARATSVA